MDDELVLLTSYFNLADARRQDSADTFRVDPSVSSGTSPDGTAALYIITEASAGGSMGPRARRVAADTVAWEYATHNDEPPASRLKAALRAAHESVEHEFDGHVTVGLSVIAVEADTVYLGQVAPAQVYVLHDGNLASIAADIEGNVPFGRALGSRAGPRITVFRDQVGPDDVLALCSSWFRRGADTEDLRECFSAGSADDIAESLLDLAKQHDCRDATAVVIEAVLAHDLDQDASDEAPPTFMEQVDTAVQALTGVGKMLWDEFRNVPPVEDDHRNGAGHRYEEPEPVGARSPADADDLETARSGSSTSGRQTGTFDMTQEVPAIVDTSAESEPAQEQSGAHPFREGLTEETPLISGDEPDAFGEAAPSDEPDPYGEVLPSDGGEESSAAARFFARDHSSFVTQEYHAAPTINPEQKDAPDAPAEHAPTAPESSTTGALETDASAQSLAERAADAEADRERKTRRRPRRARPVMRSEPTAEPRREDPSTPSSASASEIEQVNSRIQSDPELGDVIPPVQAFADTSTVEPSRIYATSKDIQAVNKRRPRRFGNSRNVVDSLGGPKVIRPGDSDIDLRRPMTRSTPPAVIWASAVGVIVVAALAAFIYLRRHHAPASVASNPYPSKVRQDIALASGAKTASQQDYWLGRAQANIRHARAYGHIRASTLAALQSRWQTTSDGLHHVTREYSPITLSNFASVSNANPSEISALPGQVFVLDRGRNSVFSISTNGGSTSGPSEVTRSGEIVSTLTIGNPVHMTADTRTPGTVLILDDKNQIVRDSSNAKTATPLTQPSQAALHPVGIATSDPDVYVLDPANNQVWRYALGVTGYNPLFQPYFDVVKPTLTRAVSFVLDGTDLYVLGSDGIVQKFDYQENPQPFHMPKLTAPLHNPTEIFTEAGTNWIWIADPSNRRIVQLDKSGNYVRSYVSGNSGMDFSRLRGFTVGPAGNTIYAVAGSQVFQFPVAR